MSSFTYVETPNPNLVSTFFDAYIPHAHLAHAWTSAVAFAGKCSEACEIIPFPSFSFYPQVTVCRPLHDSHMLPHVLL